MRSHGPHEDVDPVAAKRIGLSEKEAAFFKANGFIVKRGLIPNADLQPFVEYMWEHMLPGLDRDNPQTWIDPGQHIQGWGPNADLMAMARAAGADVVSGRAMNVPGGVNRPYPCGYGSNSIKWCEIGGWPTFNAATSAHPNVLRMVQALIGGPVRRPHRNRGCYIHFPRADVSDATLGPHNDTMPAELFGFTYLCDVPPRSGGTCIWPTSPQRLYTCLETEQRCGFHPNGSYDSEMSSIVRDVQPVEFVGKAGDVLFLHPCMVHSAGINSAMHGGGTLRVATVMEWQRAQLQGTTDDRQSEQRTLWWSLTDTSRGDGRRNQSKESQLMVRPDRTFPPALDGRDPEMEGDELAEVIWHHDAAEYFPYEPRSADMWARWNLSACEAPLALDVVEEPSWWERAGLNLPHTIVKLKDIAVLNRETGLWQLK